MLAVLINFFFLVKSFKNNFYLLSLKIKNIPVESTSKTSLWYIREICLPNYTLCDLVGTQSKKTSGTIKDTGTADPNGWQKYTM